MKKKIYYVKREVLATSIKKAMTARGVIYEIQESTSQPQQNSKIGFKK